MTDLLFDQMKAACRQAPCLVRVRGNSATAIAAAEQAAAVHGAVAVAAVCSYAADGPFAGISALLQGLVRVAERHALRSLVQVHDASLTILAPALAERYPPRYPMLTLSAPREEAVRVFGAEWPSRYINGAVDFLFALQDRLGGVCLVIGLAELDRAGALAEGFLTTLARRAGTRSIVLWASAEGACPTVDRAAAYLPLLQAESPTVGAEAASVTPAGQAEAAMGQLIQEHIAAGRRTEASALLSDAIRHCSRHGMVADALRLARQWEALIGPDAAPREIALMTNQLAGALQATGDYHGVEQVMRRILACDLEPRFRANCLYILAMLYTRYYAEKDLPLAIEYLQEAIDGLGPDASAEALGFYQNGLALVLLRMGRIAEAGDICLDATRKLREETEPDQFRLQKAVLLHNLARVMVQLRRHDEAEAYFAATLELDPYYSELYQERGTLFLRLGRTEAALDDYQRGVEYGPPSAQLAACLGNLCIETGQAEQGVTHFSRALELDEGFAYAYKGRALCYYDLGRPAEALADYNAYLRLRPNDTEALANRGSLRHDMGDLEGALADLTRALELQPENVAALANRAAVLADAGRLAEALASLDVAISLDPANDLLRQNRQLLVGQ